MVFLFVFANQNSGPSSPFGFVGEVPTRSESSPAPADLPPRSVCLPRLGRGPELLGELVGALDSASLGLNLNLQSEVRRLSRPEIPTWSGLSTFNRVSFLFPSSPHLCALCVLCGENSLSFRSSLIPRHSPLTSNSFIIRTYEKLSRKSFRIRTYKKVRGGGTGIPVCILDSGEVSWTSSTGEAATGRSSTISFPCHTSETAFHKSFACHTSKTLGGCYG